MLQIRRTIMPRRHILQSESRELVMKLQDYFEQERYNGRSLIPITKVQDRVSQALGISKRTITNINKEKFGRSGMEENVLRTPNKKRRVKPVTNINNLDVDAIRNLIYSYYSKNEYPNRERLLADLKAANLFQGGTTALCKIVRDIGFQCKKTQERKVYLERHDVILKRITFLRAAEKIENWDSVVFIEETCLNANNTVLSSDDQSQSCTSTLKVPMTLWHQWSRFKICLAGSANHGFFENGLLVWEPKLNPGHHKDINAAEFKQWFQNILLPGLPEPSIIFMHTASYNSERIQEAPTQANNKEELVAWLQNKGIDANMQMLKPELMKLVKDNKSQNVKYELDVLAQEHGHRVLRIPPYHPYNAIKIIWAQIQENADSYNNSPPFNIKNLIPLLKEACGNVTRDDWAKAVEKTRNIIRDNLERDIRIDSIIDNKYVIHEGENDNEDSTSSDSEYD